MRPLCLLVLFILSFSNVRANNIKSLTVDNGLSQSMVYSIIQDSRGFMWFGTQDGLNRYDGTSVKVFKHSPYKKFSPGCDRYLCSFEFDNNTLWFGTVQGVYMYNISLDRFSKLIYRDVDNGLCNASIRNIIRDRSGNIWIVGDGAFVLKMDATRQSTLIDLSSHLMQHGIEPTIVSIRDVLVNADGKVWFGTTGAGMISYNTNNEQIDLYTHLTDVNALLQYSPDRILIGTSGKGLQLFNINTQHCQDFLKYDEENSSPLYIRKLLKASDGKIWIGTETGVFVYEPRTQTFVSYKHKYSDVYSISDNAIHSIAEDRDGGIWVGTYFGGVNYFSPTEGFKKYYPISDENSVSGRCISEFCQDVNGDLWIATEDAGLNKYTVSTGLFSQGIIPAKNTHALLADNDNLWVGTFSSGLYRVSIKTGKYKNYKHTNSPNMLSSNDVYALFKDSYGSIWVGTSKGLHQYNPGDDSFVSINPKQIVKQVNDIKEDAKGRIWIATIGGGVFLYDRVTDSWKLYSKDEDGDVSLLNATCLEFDINGRLWLGTMTSGLYIYNSSSDSFKKKFTSSNGLINNMIYSLVKDRSGNIWGSTNKGLFRVDQETLYISTYTKENGLLSDQFNFKSGFLSKSGRMYFGGISGYVSFIPENIPRSSTTGEIMITSLELDNQMVDVREGNKPILLESIMNTKSIDIPHYYSNFGLELSEIKYSHSVKNEYYYILEGWDRMWNPITLPAKVNYSSVPYGKYAFVIKASPYSDEDILKLGVNLLPPFYMSKIAYALYAFLFLLLLIFLYYVISKKVKDKSIARQKRIDDEKEKEIYEAKISFFSNITHEIRTPLSLIKLPLNDIIEKTSPTSPQYKNLITIRDNSDRLLTLVNQLLDFRKVSSQAHEPIFIHTDLAKIVNGVISRFNPSASIKRIDIILDIPLELLMDVDVEMAVKMTSNLLNNALKHARSTIDIVLKTYDGRVSLIVANDGDKIDKEYKEKIFSPFYKLSEESDGFGLGLSLVKLLAELHQGEVLHYEDERGFTCFELILPTEQVGSLHFEPNKGEVSTEGASSCKMKTTLEHNKKKILLVDDNPDFLQYVSGLLEEKFTVYVAKDGVEAWGIISNTEINILISDIVMSQMDGIELCERIKANSYYKHIPVVLLSSGAADKHVRVNAMSKGADIIVEKPFYIEYLVAVIANLLKVNHISEVARSEVELSKEKSVLTKSDDGFINMLGDIIEDNIEDTELDINKLASLMNISRATLYRKTSEVLSTSPNDFIRSIRLKRAAELLRQREYRVNEIAYIVGFKSSSYFAKCFCRQYGVLPKDFK